MNTVELKAELLVRHVPEDAYSIGRDRDEAYRLIGVSGAWRVYYSKRGNRNNERVFSNEDSACLDLLNRLVRDAAAKGNGRTLCRERKPGRRSSAAWRRGLRVWSWFRTSTQSSTMSLCSWPT